MAQGQPKVCHCQSGAVNLLCVFIASDKSRTKSEVNCLTMLALVKHLREAHLSVVTVFRDRDTLKIKKIYFSTIA